MSEDFIERPRKNEKDGAIQYVKQLLEQALEEHRNEDVNKLEEVFRLLQTKKYGLVWEEHAEIVEEEMKTKIPVFVEEVEKKIVGNPDSHNYNFLLEGDNLHSLKLLEKTHGGKIDVIYIDPPYNTGNKDFAYNDKIVGDDDAYHHSKWLSFMSRRLSIARELLSAEGVIFISIDNNEYAQLKLLCDQIMGEEQFVTTIHVELSSTQGMKVKAAQMGNVVKNAEYILVYSSTGKKNIAKNLLYDYRPEYDTHYNKIIVDNVLVSLKEYVSSYIEPEFKTENLKNLYRKSDKFKKIVEENLDRIVADDKITGFEQSEFDEGKIYKVERAGKMYLLFNNGKKLRQLLQLSSSYGKCDDFLESTGLRKIRGDWWKEFYLDMGNVSKEGDVVFANGKKPIRLLKQIIYMSSKEDSIILDFFAGSGSTGHAVSQLNKEDGGNRKYILCTNNENNICEEVTYKRLTNIQKELPHNLKYLKTDFVDKNEFPNFQLENELLNYITPLVELEFGIDISNPSVQIILTEEHLANLIKEGKLEKDSTLFIHSEVFLDSKEEDVLSNLNISRQVIPDYYFGKELWS